MPTWTLTIDTPDADHASRHGTATTVEQAADDILLATREHLSASTVPNRYTLAVDGDVRAVIVTVTDQDGRVDCAAALELLDRIDLTSSTAPH